MQVKPDQVVEMAAKKDDKEGGNKGPPSAPNIVVDEIDRTQQNMQESDSDLRMQNISDFGDGEAADDIISDNATQAVGAVGLGMLGASRIEANSSVSKSNKGNKLRESEDFADYKIDGSDDFVVPFNINAAGKPNCKFQAIPYTNSQPFLS